MYEKIIIFLIIKETFLTYQIRDMIMNMCINCIFGGCEMEGKAVVCHVRVPLLGDFQFYSELTPVRH